MAAARAHHRMPTKVVNCRLGLRLGAAARLCDRTSRIRRWRYGPHTASRSTVAATERETKRADRCLSRSALATIALHLGGWHDMATITLPSAELTRIVRAVETSAARGDARSVP